MVDYFGWGAADADDFVGPTTGTVYFAPGEGMKIITVQVAGDTTAEADEWFNVYLSNPRGAGLGSAQAQLPILNDDPAEPPPPAGISISGSPQAAEGNSGTTAFEFTVTRSGDASGQALVDWFVWGQANAQDFSGPTAGTVYFAAGETVKTILLNVAGDTTAEPDELFNVTLSNARGGLIGTGTASGRIVDDDGWVAA